MLRVYGSANTTQAKDYFSKELSQGDYYFGAQEIAGIWGGKGASLLGLTGSVQQDAFNALVDNLHPATGENLTPHQKQNRRPGYDLTFNAPKALSVLYEYSKDERLLDVFRDAVHDTMAELEESMQVRVRRNGVNDDRTTGNLIYGSFEHYTARPAEDTAPDPQLHMHCFVMNASYDDTEEQWKAGQFGDIKRDAPYFEAQFHSRLSKGLAQLGLDIERDGKFWTIAGMDKELLAKFSNRSEQIEQLAREKQIEGARAKDLLGAQSRGAKIEGLSREMLREVWWNRLSEAETQTLNRLSEFNPQEDSGFDDMHRKTLTKQSLDFAIAHQLERQSVIPLTRLKETALREGFGAFTADDLEHALNARKDLLTLTQNGRVYATTRTILQEEQDIIAFTRNGYAMHAPMNRNYAIPPVHDLETGHVFALSDEQKEAVSNILDSTHRVMAVEGKAGVGKTTMMASLINGMEDGGTGAAILAPTADAAYDTLQSDGEKYGNDVMKKATTLASFFNNSDAWETNRGKTLIVDEAGLMSVGDMHTLFAVAKGYNNRILLVGDSSQHNSVMRGDAYRILQREAGLDTVTIENIRRQSGQYKIAVSEIARGDLLKGYDRLERMDAVAEEQDAETRYGKLASQYADYVQKEESTLTVAPTHAEGNHVTDAIRNELKQRGMLGKQERDILRYQNLQYTEAERGEAKTYEVGQMIRYQQNAKGNEQRGYIKRGSEFTVAAIKDGEVWIADKKGNAHILDRTQAGRFTVYEARTVKLAAGDRIRITEGSKSKDGARLNNGALYTVKQVNRKGDIELTNGRVLDGQQGNINYGYVTTSHASQGKTVKHVLIAQSTAHGGAASAEQFYVSVSRGKDTVQIYTDDREELRGQIQRSHQRLSATELARQGKADTRKDDRDAMIPALIYYGQRGLYRSPFMRSPPAEQQSAKARTEQSWQDRVKQSSHRGLGRE